MSRKTNNTFSVFYVLAVLAAFVFLSGCSNKKVVNFKINSVPKGAHVLYQVIGEDLPCQGEWIYLGNTPVQGARQFDEDALEDAEKITLKVVHRGYNEQLKEWDGPGFWNELDEKEVIFWTPQLVSAPQK